MQRVKLNLPEDIIEEIHSEIVEKACNSNNNIIVFSAPSGFGKTTCILRILKKLKYGKDKIYFLKIDKKDRDYKEFLLGLIKELSDLSPEIRKDYSIIDRDKILISTIENYIEKELSKINDRIGIVFFDIFNLGEKIDEYISKIAHIFHPIKNFYILFESINPLNLNEIPHYNVSYKNLALTPGDIEIMGKYIGVSLNSEEIFYLRSISDGSVLILLNILTILKNKKISAYDLKKEKLTDFLFDRMLEDFNPQERQIIMGISQIPYFDEEILEYVMGIREFENWIHKIKKTGIYLLEEEIRGKKRYSFHRFFRENMERKLRFSPIGESIFRRINSRAAEYFEAKGDIEFAIEGYLKTLNYSKAFKLIKEYIFEFVKEGKKFVLSEWINILKTKFEQELDFKYIYGIYLNAIEEFEDSEKLLQEFIDKSDDNFKKAISAHFLSRLAGDKGNFMECKKWSRLCLNFIEESLKQIKAEKFKINAEYSKTPLEILKKTEGIDREKILKEIEVRVLNLLGVSFTREGNFKKGKELYLEALEKGKEFKKFYYSIKINLGVMLYYLGEIEKAEKTFKDIWKSPEAGVLAKTVALFNYGMIQDEIKENYEEAIKCYQELLNIADRFILKTEIGVSLSNLCYSYINKGDLKKAYYYLDELRKFLYKFKSNELEKLFYINKMELLISERNIKEAFSYFERINEKFEDSKDIEIMIGWLLIKSKLFFYGGNIRDSIDTLKSIFKKCKECNYKVGFLRVIRTALKLFKNSEYIKELREELMESLEYTKNIINDTLKDSLEKELK